MARQRKTFPCAHCAHVSVRHDDAFTHWHDTHAGDTQNARGEWGPLLDTDPDLPIFNIDTHTVPDVGPDD